MGFFKKNGGILNVIRCDEPDYLVWKWVPSGQRDGSRENAIRYGSQLRVKDGEVAVFVYKQQNGTQQDYIVGPMDETIKTSNFPVLSSIMGLAFGGNQPFQAEIYYINLAGVETLKFFIKRVELAVAQHENYQIPASVKGSIKFNITDYKKFIKLYKLKDKGLSSAELMEHIKDPAIGTIKSIVGRTPDVCKFSVFKINNYLDEISKYVTPSVRERIEEEFGINISQVNISDVMLDKESSEYQRVDKILMGRQEMIADQMAKTTAGQVADERDLSFDFRTRMNEEAQRVQKLKTEQEFINVHQLNVQGDVAKTAAKSLGEMGSGGGGLGDGGFNPAAMMTGMMMGGSVGSSMANMMGDMTQSLNTPQPPPTPIAEKAQYHLANSGAQTGPFTLNQLKSLLADNVILPTTYIWKQGMSGWVPIADCAEVASIYAVVPPPPPSLPPPL